MFGFNVKDAIPSRDVRGGCWGNGARMETLPVDGGGGRSIDSDDCWGIELLDPSSMSTDFESCICTY